MGRPFRARGCGSYLHIAMIGEQPQVTVRFHNAPIDFTARKMDYRVQVRGNRGFNEPAGRG